MEYPEEIYAIRDGGLLIPTLRSSASGVGWGRRHAYDIGYRAGGAEHIDPLAGYANLTAAIAAGDPIDWERLDGLRVQCVNPDVGTNGGVLKRELGFSAQSPFGWWNTGMDISYTCALVRAWEGKGGWTLWIEGEIPLVRKTADQLEVGTYFLSKTPDFSGRDASMVYVGENEYDDLKTIYYAPSMLKSTIPASEWVVIEELGTFQKPEENNK